MYEINGYTAIGAPWKDAKGKIALPEMDEIRSRYLTAVLRAVNDHAVGVADAVDRLTDALAAGEVLLFLDEREAHDRAIVKVGIYQRAEAPDVGEVLGRIATGELVSDMIELALRWGVIGSLLDLLPRIIGPGTIEHMEPAGYEEAWREARDKLSEITDASADADAFTADQADHAERLFAWATDQRVAVFWRTRRWASGGRRVLGKARKLSDTERALSGTPATHAIELHLGAWAEMSQAQKARLVLHELLHFDPMKDEDGGAWRVKFRAHDIEEFTATLKLYGAADLAQVHAVAGGATNPNTATMAKAWDAVLDDAGQSLLFEVLPVRGA